MTQASTPTVAQTRQVELILSQLEELPTLPAVAVRLLQVTTAHDSDAREVIRLIESDQSLAAKILSMAKRASTGIRSTAATIEKVVLLLGFEAVRNAVLSIKVFEVFDRPGTVQDTAFDRKEFWKHSLAVGCAARLLAKEIRTGIDAEEAFICGLLHDMGKVALDTCLPKSFDRIVRQTNAENGCIAEIERKLLGLDHTIAGRRLAMRWGLPGAIVEAVWLHHQGTQPLPDAVEHRRLVQLVYLADLIAREQRIGYSGNFRFPQHAVEACAAMRLDPNIVDRVVEQLAGAIEERAHLIGLEDLTSSGLYLEALSSANEELARTNASLTQTNRRLEARSRFFKALAELTGRIRSDDSMSQVCAAAAECVRTGLAIGSALVYTRPEPDGICFVGLADAQAANGQLVCLEPDQDRPDRTEAPASGGAWLTPAQPNHQAILDRFGADLGSPPYWTLPIVHAGECVATALFACDEDHIRRISAQQAELESLSFAVGLLVASVRARSSAERLSEQLAELNRRLEQTQADLLRTRSLAAVGEMAAGAAHELNNPLAVIAGRAQLMLDSVRDEQTRQALATIREQAQRCSQIVSELMAFAKPKPPQPESVCLQTFLAELRNDWLSRLGLRAEQFVVTLPDEPIHVWADPDQLKEIFGEILRNAFEAMSRERAELVVNCLRDVSDRVRVSIRDNGRGMSRHVLEHAFDPFFSDRPAGRGRGMGLARAYRLAEINNIRLWLESTPGSGTTAWISLPTGENMGTSAWGANGGEGN